MPFLGSEAPGEVRSSSATLTQPFSAITIAAGVSTPLTALDTSNTFQQSVAIMQTALGGGLLTVEVQMAFGSDFMTIDRFVIGALNVTERRVYRQANHAMQLRFTSVAGNQIISGSLGGMG